MTSSFDLFRNPFVLLRVDLSATSKQISEAFEDAVTDAIAPEPELVVARQAVLAPMLRLDAEVAALPDTPSPEWRSILVALKSAQTLPILRQAFEKVASLSRSNLLTHAASRAQPDAPTFAAWIKAHSGVDLDKIHREIEHFREIAGVVRPDRAALSSALSSLREKQARALFEAFKSPADAIHAITICTKQAISNAVTAQIDTLSTLLSAYSRYVDRELSFRKERVIHAAHDLRSDPDAPDNLEILVDALKFWNQANQPLQLLESHKGRDEPAAQELFQEIRSVAISLANDQSRFDVALSLTKACGGDPPLVRVFSCGVGVSGQFAPAAFALPVVDAEVGQDKNLREQETVQRRHAVEICDALNGQEHLGYQGTALNHEPQFIRQTILLARLRYDDVRNGGRSRRCDKSSG
jgi:hypothetical protein